MLEAWRSKIAANAAGSAIDASIAIASGEVILGLFPAASGLVRELARTTGEQPSEGRARNRTEETT